MRLNRAGRAAMGIGDGVVSVDGRVIAAGGGACWLTEDTILYQTKRGTGYVLEACNTKTGTKTLVDDKGANEIAAGGGRWAAWGPRGVRTSTGATNPTAGLLDVSREGAIVLCPDRQSGRGAEIHHASGETVTLPDVRANAVRLVGPALVWVQGGKVRAGLSPPSTIAAPNYTPVPVLVGDAWWLLYQDGERLLLQPWGEPVGYIVHIAPTTYSPDAVTLDARTIRVAWSHTAGEGPSALRVKDIDLKSPRVRLDRPGSGPKPPTLPVPPPQEEPPMPDYLGRVRQARDEFKSFPPSVERGWRVLNRAVELLGEDFGLLSKPGGTNWNGYSIDCVMRRTGETWDVLGDAEGAAKPQWSRTKPTGMSDPSKWRPCVVDDGGVQPAVEPQPMEPPPMEPPPSDDIAALKAEIAALRAELVVLRSEVTLLQEKLG